MFELATKKHAELSRDHIHEENDEKALARCSYKVAMILSLKKIPRHLLNNSKINLKEFKKPLF